MSRHQRAPPFEAIAQRHVLGRREARRRRGERPAGRPTGDEPGLWVMDTPGHGGESITGIAAAGSQVMSFSTGGGHTINHPLMITMRLTGNRESWAAMAETMEVDVSDIFDGTPLEVAAQVSINDA